MSSSDGSLIDLFRFFSRAWKVNGVSRPAYWVNMVFLTLLIAVIPVERFSEERLARVFRSIAPQIDPLHVRVGDPVRILIGTLIRLVFLGIPTKGSKFAFLDAMRGGCARIETMFGRLVHAIEDRLCPELDDSVHVPGAAHKGALMPLWLERLITVPLALVALLFAGICVTQPFHIEGQVIFFVVMLTLAFILAEMRARISLMLLFVISMVVSARYLWWRSTATLNHEDFWGLTLGIALLASEFYAFIVMVLGYFQVCWVLDRKPVPMPQDRSVWPSVDVFIPTYNESLDVIKPTLFAALNLDWPREKLHVYLLDDGSRPEFERYARGAGAGYIKREQHNHAKAGNINHALTVTDGQIIAIFDCDHVPNADFLQKTIGVMIQNDRIALVQTPHHFYSPDQFEKNLGLSKRVPNDNSLFHDFIQKGNDTWNATMFCGSNAVIRRDALLEVGGIAVETVTEDAHTSLKLNRRGWSSAFISEPLASGLSTESLRMFIGQRIRWARGMIQIFRLDNPFFGRGLTLPQRLCFFNGMIHFLHGLPRLIFLLAPLPYLFADIYVIKATAAAIFAFVLPHMIHSCIGTSILQRGYRQPFLGALYEAVLSWYILLPTTVALIFPHKGKFNVTDKGTTNASTYLDWGIAKPFLILAALNALGLAVGIWRVLVADPSQYFTLLINLGWLLYNLVVLGAAVACAVEKAQTEAFAWVPFERDVTLEDAGQSIACRMTEFSQRGVRFRFESGLRRPDNAILRLGEGRFKVRRNGGIWDLQFDSVQEEIAFNRETFSSRGLWKGLHERVESISVASGFGKLVGYAIYGYRSLFVFGARSSRLTRALVLFVLSMLPIRRESLKNF